MWTVYEHIFPNGKRYVGITSMNPEKRWKNGLGYRGQKIIWTAIKSYSWEKIQHNVLFTNLTKTEACNKEVELIAKFNLTNRKYGYNAMTGGENPEHTEESKERNRQAHLGKKQSIHTIQKRVEKLKGKTRSKDFCEQMRQINLGKGKKVLCIETGMIYNTAYEASVLNNMSHGAVAQCAAGKRYTAGGYHWEYLEVEICI